ncbi:hypothetical protein HanHA300_Chr16g0590781 [Helianthus annuus]|nr:hypothetical protein HanHA300_Chr16g0590781 [Helianthus annuus]
MKEWSMLPLLWERSHHLEAFSSTLCLNNICTIYNHLAIDYPILYLMLRDCSPLFFEKKKQTIYHVLET